VINKKVTLKTAVEFHGHLGPYLILGILAGELALKKLKCKKYFGLDVRVFGANMKPKSCLIDGLQLSTGATFGKGNIKKVNAESIMIVFKNRDNNKRIFLGFNQSLIADLKKVKTHRDSESLARKLYKAAPLGIFELTTKN